MTTYQLLVLKADAEKFMQSLQLPTTPEIVFVEHADVSECKVNDLYEKENKLYLNTSFLSKHDLEFVRVLVLHEIYHFAKQKITEHSDVIYMRDSNQWHFMQWMDVEADLQVVLFLKKDASFLTFRHYLSTLYKGVYVFRDKHLRYPKLERFIGSMLSVRAALDNGQKIVYLPQLSYNSISLQTIDFDTDALNFQKLDILGNELAEWEKAFQDASMMEEEEYIDLLVRLTEDFHTIIIPKMCLHEAS